jgi:hypothetical protein
MKNSFLVDGVYVGPGLETPRPESSVVTECLKTLKLSNATTSAFTRPLVAWRLVILCYGRKDLEALGLAPRVGSRAVAIQSFSVLQLAQERMPWMARASAVRSLW